MRIGSGYNYLVTMYNSQRNQKAYSDALTPLSTGKKMNFLSDSPTHVSEYFKNQQELSQIDTYLDNISTARSQVNITDNILEQMQGLLNEAYELSLQGNDQTITSNDISNIATRFSTIQTDFLRMANSKVNGKYIFSGYETSTQPFSGSPVTYAGDTNTISVQVSETTSVPVSVNASTTFMSSIDLFDTLGYILTAIQAQDEATLGTKITDLQNGMAQLVTSRAAMANSNKTLDNTEEYLGKFKIQLSERMSHIADVDIAEASTELSFREYTLQASMALARKIFEMQNSSFNM